MTRTGITTKDAVREITFMVSALKSNSTSNPAWAECCREVDRVCPIKWIIESKNGKRKRQVWNNAIQKLLSEYGKIDEINKLN